MRRLLLLAGGWLMVGLAIVGAVLPIMPTVPFLIVAAAFFARSSPELEARLMNHKHFGPSLVQWRRHGAISTPAKLLAVTAMAGSFMSVLFFAEPPLVVLVAFALVLLTSAVFVVTRPRPVAAVA
ncbi:DUF454 domain-containing protein [Martelella alba]|uniref:DUF454 domain-containing protein n=1 Tax=Martelella alba TaxID=2590451 RepID=A0A506UJT0_9HYPH|nr:YbaN family protein [Martelella alba]TPW33565.1 DUF454 domain-containing protein [Martelella alba]